MKKIFLAITLIITSLVIFTLGGCEKPTPYYEYLSELKTEIFHCEKENLTASWGFKMENGERVFGLTFNLTGFETDAVYRTVSTELGGEKLSATFTLSPSTHSDRAFIETDSSFALKTFTATLVEGQTHTDLTFNSIIPDQTIDYKTALNKLKSDHDGFISANVPADGSPFIKLRVLVKNQTPYYFVGVESINGGLKAFLLDGFNGDTLTAREVF